MGRTGKHVTRKGIILAGGTGTRLHPSTISVSKQLMPVYDKPMIYYPLSVLMQAGIRETLIITTPHDQPAFKHLLGDGHKWGLEIQYAVQPSPDGLAQALIIAEDFLGGHPSALILGDNLFFGQSFNETLQTCVTPQTGATVFGYYVKNPESYGVVGFDENHNVVSLVEKPENPASHYAVTGLYFYDDQASSLARQVKPSSRGELEITALNSLYLSQGQLTVELLDDGTTWLDTGTHKSLLQAAQFVSVIEERQGRRICCPEEIAYRQGWISAQDLKTLARPLKKSGYGAYLLNVLQEGDSKQ
ncbi:MAG TPA: glucose-1-phosphate thymidylyltransferase [Hellea balneolensis]|uniref:Glucose-1-phosphate thymidylyltransferase n=1 Tax=Hellea balneolensis TaxID=287478 RepID=A0A7C5LWD8_9PROT|nr:glucose-1-phosphate thymidylyltransferase [Hellea balneolensis]